ncbi:hypothetical protein KFE25_013263 [Diacronema lutheri]|uniref:PDEase domain-containing protein n=1 Tax=Diacronema lutheri TaxID=2081491 RepID=A0A8J5XUH5_DIALT|nr:hypothetical protein KFE25_013263 [Diacronema lutheri]
MPREAALVAVVAGAGGLCLGIVLGDLWRASRIRRARPDSRNEGAEDGGAWDGAGDARGGALSARPPCERNDSHGEQLRADEPSAAQKSSPHDRRSPEVHARALPVAHLRRSASMRCPRTAEASSRRARHDALSRSGRSAHSLDSLTSPQAELAADNARRMMAHERADFRSAETIFFVLRQMTEPSAAQEVERVVTPHEKLKGAFRRVKDGLHVMHVLHDDCPPPSSRSADAAANPPFLAMARARAVPRELLSADGVRRCLEGAELWDFDVFALDKASNGHALVALAEHLLLPGCCAQLGLGAAELHAFLSAVEGAYRTDIAYHTATHAADVLHAACWLLRAGLVPALPGDDNALLHLSVVIAATVHDVAHPGVNGDFLQKTSDPLAILYNDRSVLENMHAAICFRLLSGDDAALLAPLAPAQRARVRAWVLSMILATDMKMHFPLLARLAEIEPWSAESELPDDIATFALGVLLHAADLSGPTKPQSVVRWSRRVSEEFFVQGEREAELGLKVTDGFERATAGALWTQRNAAFVNFIVAPLFEAIRSATPDARLDGVFEGIGGSVAQLDQADPAMGVE